MLINQTSLFLIFTINGILIGIIFDIFRIFRKTIKTSDFVTYIEDFLFWIITAIVLLYSIFTYNNGELRFFMFLAVILGFIIYIFTISSYLIKINVNIINTIKKISIKTLKIIYTPIIKIFKILKKITFKPLLFISENLKKNMKNIKNKLKSQKVKNDNNIKNTNKIIKNFKHKIPKKKIRQKKQKDTINLQKS